MPSIIDVLRENLTDEQLAAATDTNSRILTLACAGSGKSRTLAYRIARLLAEDEPPESIVAFTFTEKAAEAIKRRVAEALAAAGQDATMIGAMYIGTMHSYCQYVLGEMDARYRQFEVLDDNRLKLFLISRYSQLGLHILRRQRQQRYFAVIKEVSGAWTTMNNELVDINDVISEDSATGYVLRDLRQRLDADEFIDFSLMIRLVVEALEHGEDNAERAVAPLQHLMVDEYQDVNTAEEALIRELHMRAETLFVVGDDDQSIYGWRGADVNNILTFGERYHDCSEYTLSHNFRSTQAIVEAADAFAAAELGPTRIAKNPTATNPSGPRDMRIGWFSNRLEEAEWVADRIALLLGTAYEENGEVRGLTPADFAILMRSTRSNEQDGRPRHSAFTDALARRGIRYSLEAGGGLFDRQQVVALRDSFELLRNDSPDRNEARMLFDGTVRDAYPHADFEQFTRVLANWGRQIHAPIDAGRRRVYPQQLVHDLLQAFGIGRSRFRPEVMQEIGLFSKIIQDVETVYLSVDTQHRFAEILNFLSNVAESGYDIGTMDLLYRPDAVLVSTVHKVKGLEFPVVFIVDAEQNRFPGRRSSYRGWLPANVIRNALNRGAYQSTRDEEARLFYTATTRAERYLYITGCEYLPGGRQSWNPSQFSQRLSHDELSNDIDGVPHGLSFATPRRRFDETILPTTYSDIRYYLRCPHDYRLRKIYEFSPPIPEMFGFGQTVHASVNRIHQQFSDRPPTGEEAEEIARENFHLKHIPPSTDPQNRPGGYERAQESAGRIARRYVEAYGEDFTRQRQVEARFEIPVEQAVITGSIDLLLKMDEDNQILDANVIDFKAMEGGDEPEESERLYWAELALQVQLYAKAANDILGENARTGEVHLLKDNKRVQVPVSEVAVRAAVENVEWAVDRILAGDFPMRPHQDSDGKCENCDFAALCPQTAQPFMTNRKPPPIHVPGEREAKMARAFSEFDGL